MIRKSATKKHRRKSLAPGSKNVRIRSAKREDAGEMAQLSGQLGYPLTRKEMELRIRTVLTRRSQKLLVADIDGKVAGWLEVFIPLSVLNWGKAEVGALVVDAASRGRGVGHKLLEAGRIWSRQRGSRFIYLRSNVKRRGAHKFYLKSGYKIYKSQHVFKLLIDE